MSKRFSYVKYDSEISAKSEMFKVLCEQLDQAMVDNLPHGRERNLAHTYLEQVFMWIGKSLRDMQIEKDGQVNHVAARGE